MSGPPSHNPGPPGPHHHHHFDGPPPHFDGPHPQSDGLHPQSYGPHPQSDGSHPQSDGHPAWFGGPPMAFDESSHPMGHGHAPGHWPGMGEGPDPSMGSPGSWEPSGPHDPYDQFPPVPSHRPGPRGSQGPEMQQPPPSSNPAVPPALESQPQKARTLTPLFPPLPMVKPPSPPPLPTPIKEVIKPIPPPRPPKQADKYYKAQSCAKSPLKRPRQREVVEPESSLSDSVEERKQSRMSVERELFEMEWAAREAGRRQATVLVPLMPHKPTGNYYTAQSSVKSPLMPSQPVMFSSPASVAGTLHPLHAAQPGQPFHLAAHHAAAQTYVPASLAGLTTTPYPWERVQGAPIVALPQTSAIPSHPQFQAAQLRAPPTGFPGAINLVPNPYLPGLQFAVNHAPAAATHPSLHTAMVMQAQAQAQYQTRYQAQHRSQAQAQAQAQAQVPQHILAVSAAGQQVMIPAHMAVVGGVPASAAMPQPMMQHVQYPPAASGAIQSPGGQIWPMPRIQRPDM